MSKIRKDVRSKARQSHNDAADQQPFRCVECGEAVSSINPKPCACIRAITRETVGEERIRTMKTYRVRWEIDIEASSPRVAAEKARLIQEDPESIATVYQVAERKTKANGLFVEIDLEEVNE